MNLEPFGRFILSKGLVAENQIIHYQRWVKAFLDFYHLQESVPFSDDQLEGYIDSLASTRPKWQLEQAREAISISF